MYVSVCEDKIMTRSKIMTRIRAFLQGAGSVLDLGGFSPEEKLYSRTSTLEALGSDFQKVGHDLYMVISSLSENQSLLPEPDSEIGANQAKSNYELQE